MFKKPLILSILFVVCLIALLAAGPKLDSKIGLQSKKSHAEKLWKTSGHADSTSEAFNHWNENDPAEVPTSCAKCHSTPGYIDFLDNGVVDSPALIGTTVECSVCHSNKETGTLRDHTSVTFPSGITVENLGHSALCMECHQGRESTTSVNERIDAAKVPNDDTVSSRLSFRNIHYFAAGATQLGTAAKGGYEYSGKTYDARFSHITGYNACNTCHNSHSLEVNFEACTTCHTDPQNTSYYGGIKDAKNIRYLGSCVDYDGDGDMEEGIYYEIEGFQEKLLETMQEYARKVAGTPIAYDGNSYPYFFIDTNNNGVVDSSEASSSNRYSSFTARLVKATYNYQFSMKDPACFAHGGKYIIELLYDSMEDLNKGLTVPVDISGMSRTDEGHFDGSSEAWRHWDGGEEVSASCAKCHSAEGLPYFLTNGVSEAAPISNGLLCTTCHTSPPSVRTVGAVTFPSGVAKDLGDSSNLCINCHQGRESKFSIDKKVSSPGPYTFTNIHYFPVGAVLYGSEVHGGYEFEGKSYAGQKSWPNHNGRFDTCIECHMSTQGLCDDCRKSLCNHNVHKPNPSDCVFCHGQDISQPNPGSNPANFEFSGIRPASSPDYDGDGNTSEALKYEIAGLEDALYAQIKAYANNVIGAPIVYDEQGYPYFFNDKNGNGILDPAESSSANSYRRFDAALLKAAYNLQLSKKEPHGFIHNSRYIAQLLVDSIGNLGGDISAYTWR